MRTLVKVAAGAALLLALAGCGGSTAGFSALTEKDATAVELPAHIEVEHVAPGSVRLLAERDDHSFYVANALPGGVCLIYANRQHDSSWLAGCTLAEPRQFSPTEPSPLEISGSGINAKLAVDGYDASKDLADGWEQLHPNLLVRGL
ncbi:hypothetical protein [Arthrobacter sp.]|uniref:hypothetical protein n=1 Tax=Arthrobacter sp. TaxID=1667 RepID=UPI0033951653